MKQKAFAKVNIFLKITGVRENYHEIASRFMVVQNLYDEIAFVEQKCQSFTLEGDFDCALEQNTIYKAYRALQKATNSKKLEQFFLSHKVVVEKRIPSFAGLGGGSSDAATFLKMCNEVCGLGLSLQELAKIGLSVGADVPFFVYGYTSANVRGIGEIVEPFEEELLDFEIQTPKVAISTPKVYQAYREHFFNPLSKKEATFWLSRDSKTTLKHENIISANDLFRPALYLYKELESCKKEGWFFSGSGSSFFRAL